MTDSMNKSVLRITEIFYSIQGESTWAGTPCTFIRLTGCPLRCTWCDTAYAFDGGRLMSFEEILQSVKSYPAGIVEITGGEPLVHPGAFELIRLLIDKEYTVLVETSGAFDIGALDPRAHKIMDLKCPGSGELKRNLWSNLDHLTERDEIKFVVKDRIDYEWARKTIYDKGLEQRLEEGSLRALLISPVWGQINLEALASWVLEDALPVRFQLQLHKQIWGSERTGV